MNPPPKPQFCRLELYCSVVALCLMGGTAWGLGLFDLLIALVLLVWGST
jgi:hypothetical protein